METQASIPPVKAVGRKVWRDRIAFWIIGLQIRFGYVILLVAAKDILIATFQKGMYSKKARYCHELTTGLVLVLANAPALLSHWVLPYLPVYSYLFVTISMLISIVGYFLLAFGLGLYVNLVSVVFISIGYAIGDYKLNNIRSAYPYRTARCYDDGIMHAQFMAALYFTGLRFLKINFAYIMLSLILLPVLALGCFWLLLRSPKSRKSQNEMNALLYFNLAPKTMSCDEKSRYIYYLMKYIIPLSIMTFLQGFVNQGLYEFIYFYENVVEIDLQYCFYIFFFNLGCYACLVTKNLLITRYLSICIMFQLIVVSVFLIDAIFRFIPFLWTICLLAYIQGIIHGIAYTSAMDKMLENEASEFLHVAKAIIKSTIFLSSILSGAFDVGVHYILSKSPEPERP